MSEEDLRRPARRIEEVGEQPAVIITTVVSYSPSASGQFVPLGRYLCRSFPDSPGPGTLSLQTAGGTYLVYFPPFSAFFGSVIAIDVGGHYFAIGTL